MPIAFKRQHCVFNKFVRIKFILYGMKQQEYIFIQEIRLKIHIITACLVLRYMKEKRIGTMTSSIY